MMKSTGIVLVFMLTAFFGVHASSRQLSLKLPVRVMVRGNNSLSNEYVTGLNKEDFELRINGKPVPVMDFFRRSRSLAGNSSGRQLVLSVDATGYGKPLADAVSHFIHRVLVPADKLMLRSPLRIYSIDTTGEKDKILQQIEAYLEKDIRQWKADKKDSLDSLLQSMEILEKKLAAKKAGIRSVLLFLNNFAHQWRQYDKRFLLANLEQYPEMASLMARGNSEKWVIHFRERDLLPMLSGYRSISAAIRQWVSSLPKNYAENARLIGNSLDNIEKSMLFAEDFPLDELLNAFLGVNINYSVISFDSRPQESNPSSISPGYEKILQEITRRTGGRFLMAPQTLVKSLDTLTQHVDHYYELVFALGGQAEDKIIEVKVIPSSAAVYYKKRFRQDELKWLMNWLKQEITLSAVSLEGHRLAFTLSGFKQETRADSPGNTGLVKVDVRLINDRNTTVYQTGNTLKPSSASVNISINLPAKYSGYFKLSITAQDVIARQESQVNKYVKL
jgi:hypothetical protein